MKRSSNLSFYLILLLSFFSLNIFISSCCRCVDGEPNGFCDEDKSCDDDDDGCISDGNCNEDCASDPDCPVSIGANTITLECSNITEDITLVDNPDATVDYFIDCVMNVKAKVNINPGVVIVFGDDAGLVITDEGHLNAIGTAGSKITFRGQQAVKGFWRGIHFGSNTLQNQLEQVVIQDAGLEEVVYYGNDITSLMIYDGQISLNNVTIQNGAGHGLTIYQDVKINDYSELTITNHDKEPLYISSKRVGDLDGLNSDYSGNLIDFISVYPHALDADATWQQTNVPYLIENDDVLETDEAWTIEAGVTMVMQEDGGLAVDDGSLTISGTGAEPVIIRGREAVKGFWRGIHIESTSINNNFTNLQVSDAGLDEVFYYSNTVTSILAYSGSIKLNNVQISNGSGYGLTLYNDAQALEYNNVTITTHDEEPLYIGSERIGDLDGMASDYTGNTKDFILVAEGDITSECTWTKTNVPYLIDNGTIDILAATIMEAGTTVTFKETSGLGVTGDGSFDVRGTSADKVTFTGQSPVNGYWLGILYATTSINNRITHANIEFGGGDEVYYWGNAEANLTVYSGGLIVEDCHISNSAAWGIFIHDDADCDCINNTFANNDSGDIGP